MTASILANRVSRSGSDHGASSLVVTFEDRELTTHPLNGERTVIGRSPDSTLCIKSKYLSWRHAVIDFDRSGAYIIDLKSRNHTYLNGVRVDKAQLRDGDEISIGFHRLKFRAGQHAVPLAEVHAGSVNTSSDSFRAFVDAAGEDPQLLAHEIGTEALDRDDLPLDAPPVDRDLPAISDLAGSLSADDVEAFIASLDDHEHALESLEDRFSSDIPCLTRMLCNLFEYEPMSAHALMELAPRFDLMDLAACRDRQCVLLHDGKALIAAMADPFDAGLRPWVESRFPQALRWVLVSSGDLAAVIARHEQSMKAMDAAIDVSGSVDDALSELEDLSLASISQDSSPIVRLVNSTLYDALKAGASDIHMETGAALMEVRYRIDGVLAHVATISGRDVAEQVISRIKVMSELDIAERRIPQDGRFKTAFDKRPIDFRVSIMPSSFGEDAVLRVLDKQAVNEKMTDLGLDSLGFDPVIVDSLRRLSERPYGMLLVTGPTGSGKTTTLYGAISETNSGLGKVVTIEDPVEYQLAGVLQIPVNEKKGLTFARGLRSILRHDPDKIMVGEIRDPETAQIAIQSALTGHLVFTTVHANNVFDVLSRFLHMGVDAYSFVSALNGILAQRLLRITCSSCGESITPTEEMLAATGEPVEIARAFNWRAGHGCGECRGTGYRGRKAVGELLVLNDEMREAIIGRMPVRQLKELALANGIQFIRTAALALVREGLTTMEEVDRVTTMA